MPIYKCIYLVKRSPSLTEEEFPRRWRQHAKLAATTRLNNYFTGVVQCSREWEADALPNATRDYDGVSLLDMRDRNATRDIWDEPEQGAILAPDELLTFSRLIRECMITTEEQVTREGPYTGVLLLRFLRRARSLSPDRFLARWRDTQSRAELAGESSDLVRRAVSNVVIDPPPPDFPFDLITELWFDDLDAARRYARDCGQQAGAAAEHLCAQEGNVFFYAKVTHTFRAHAGQELEKSK
jgi:hypothetical protein